MRNRGLGTVKDAKRVRQRSVVARDGLMSSCQGLRLDAAEFSHARQFAVINALLAVPERGLDDADVADESHEAGRFDGCGMVAAPHCSVEGDVTFNQAGAKH